MNNFLTITLGTLALLAVAGAGPALALSEDTTLTLAEAVALARENNGELKALRQESRIGEAARLKSGLRLNPVLDLEAESGALTGSSSENRLSIGLSQDFLTGGKREKRIAVADSELRRYRASLANAERLLLLEVKQGYHDLVLAQERLDLARKSRELGSRLLHVARERFAAGDIPEIEVNLAQVEVARGEAAIIEAQRDLVPARRKLSTLLGGELSRPLADGSLPSPATDLAALKAQALASRPDLLEARSEAERREAEVALADAERLPDLTAGVALSVESSRTELGGMSERDSEVLLGVKLSMPIPLFDRNQAGLMEARARRSAAEIRSSFARQNVEREVEEAAALLADSEAALRLYSGTILPQLSENLKLVQQAYQYGEIGVIQVIEEQRTFLEVNRAHLAARHQRDSALARLEAAVGIEFSAIDGGKR